jgi:Leucine-rich repeat (LRR) protein
MCNTYTSLATTKNLNLSNTGVIIAHLEPLSIFESLASLDLSNNKLDKFPTPILTLQQLSSLDISHNQIRSLPSKVGNMQSLNVFKFNNNPVEQYLTVAKFGTAILKKYLACNEYDKLSMETMDSVFRYQIEIYFLLTI